MKTQYHAATSLDGFIATEDDSLDWLFALGHVDDTSYPEFIAGVGAMAMGATTYEWVRRHADQVVAETGSPWPSTQPARIFSHRTLPPIPGADLRFVAATCGPCTPRWPPRRITTPPLRLVSARRISDGFAELRYEARTRDGARSA